MNCRECKRNCCTYMGFPIYNDDHRRWVELHGVKVERFGVLDYAIFDVPCKMLKNGKCTIYNDRPDTCKIANCDEEFYK